MLSDVSVGTDRSGLRRGVESSSLNPIWSGAVSWTLGTEPPNASRPGLDWAEHKSKSPARNWAQLRE
jgi:hypothetical protein